MRRPPRFPAVPALAAPVLAAFVSAGPLLAAPLPARPPLLPTRDVTVAYRVEAAGRPAEMLTVAFAGDGTRLRATLSGWPGALLVDRRSHTALLVVDAAGLYTPLPGGGHELDDFLLEPGMRFERGREERVLGLACTDWRVQAAQGIAAACVTADGVILRGQGTDRHGRQGSLTATEVRYATLPPGTFAPPPGFHEMRLPQGGLRALLGVR
jgi:hypothetical protein